MHNIYISEWLSLSMFSSNPLAECGLYFIYYLGCGCGGTTIYFKLRGCASAPLARSNDLHKSRGTSGDGSMRYKETAEP